MFCGRPAPTQLDLRFRLLGFAVRVSPFFWLTMTFFGPDFIDNQFITRLLIWLVCAFISILIHELGHALAYRWFRCAEDEICLNWCGGLAFGSRAPGHWRNIVISLAGPVAQLMICVVLWFSIQVQPWDQQFLPFSEDFYDYLFNASLFWALFNLLPIYPLDGGQICREFCIMAGVGEPFHRSLYISLGTCGFMLLLGISILAKVPTILMLLPSWFPVIANPYCLLFIVALAYGNWQELQALKNPYADADRDW